MRFLKRTEWVHVIVLFIGVVIGIQVPTLISDYKTRQYERDVFEQIKRFPKDSNNWMMLSQLRWLRGDKDGAIQAAKKALELNPENILAMEKIAYTYVEQGDVVNGKKWLQRCLTAEKNQERFRALNKTLSRLDDFK